VFYENEVPFVSASTKPSQMDQVLHGREDVQWANENEHMEVGGVVDVINSACLSLVEWADYTQQRSTQLGMSGPGSEAPHVESMA